MCIDRCSTMKSEVHVCTYIVICLLSNIILLIFIYGKECIVFRERKINKAFKCCVVGVLLLHMICITRYIAT